MSAAEKRRVVITGIGVVAPNGVGVPAYEEALRAGRSGLKTQESMIEAKFGCTVAGSPEGVDELCEKTFGEDELLAALAKWSKKEAQSKPKMGQT